MTGYLAFAFYAILCLYSMRLNKNGNKREMCLICFYALAVGMATGPLVAVCPPIIGYGILCAINTVAALVMPPSRAYRFIPVLFLLGMILCLYGGLSVHYGFYESVPYVLITHGLNVLQIIILVVCSDRMYRKFGKCSSLDFNDHASDVYFIQSDKGID